MKKVLRANKYFLIILLLEIFLPTILVPLYVMLGISDVRLLLLFNHIGLFLIPAAIYILVTKESVKDTFKLNKIYLKDIFLVILLGFACQPIMTFFSMITAFFFNNEIGAFIGEISSTPYLILLSLVAVLPSITEEVTIRGVVLSGYKNKNKYLAALITGLFFGILHLDPQQFLYATVLGFILALLVRITNSIFSACILHFIINGTSVTLSKISSVFMENPEVTSEVADMSLKSLAFGEKLQLFVFYGVIAIVFSTFVYMIIKKLEELNIKRGVIREDVVETNTEENVFNWPFIVTIIVYIIYIVIQTMYL